jgi:hypothetical protein
VFSTKKGWLGGFRWPSRVAGVVVIVYVATLIVDAILAKPETGEFIWIYDDYWICGGTLSQGLVYAAPPPFLLANIVALGIHPISGPLRSWIPLIAYLATVWVQWADRETGKVSSVTNSNPEALCNGPLDASSDPVQFTSSPRSIRAPTSATPWEVLDRSPPFPCPDSFVLVASCSPPAQMEFTASTSRIDSSGARFPQCSALGMWK